MMTGVASKSRDKSRCPCFRVQLLETDMPPANSTPSTIVIFGASGDLTSRKLIPALYSLHRKARLPAGTKIVGVSRTEYSHDAWRKELGESTAKAAGEAFAQDSWNAFAANVFYSPGDITDGPSFERLSKLLAEIEGDASRGRVYYLSTAPRFYEPAILALGEHGMADESRGSRRIVIEKPFGTNQATAHRLNEVVHQAFRERQVFRIDHYLGKETVQNLFVFRFANTIFEPIWNRNYIDHVQITVAEEVDVGHRGDYYDTAGVLRDMFQNHLLQLLSITAMEPPVRFEADAVRNEKVKVLRAIQPMAAAQVSENTVRGRYRGYLDAKHIPPTSQTATFASLRLDVDNWRWKGVPFYLRSGKAMSCRTTQIVVQFREPPHMMFGNGQASHCDANRLVIQVQPAEGIQLQLQTKVPDSAMQLRLTDLDFRFQGRFTGELPEAYERLLLDAISGDASLFARADEVELAWGIIDPILAAWESTGKPALAEYEPGLWGPEESTEWMQQWQGRCWFDICPVLRPGT
jgi:glucose-6-phosphate 1-dehydrogenase